MIIKIWLSSRVNLKKTKKKQLSVIQVQFGNFNNNKKEIIFVPVFRGSGAVQGNCLVLKSRVQLNDLLEDPLFAIVFTLDYVISETLSDKDRKVCL